MLKGDYRLIVKGTRLHELSSSGEKTEINAAPVKVISANSN